MSLRPLIPAALASAVLCLPAFQATAADVILTSGAAGNCQSALPVFDGNIRKRPLAVVNEGTSSAFVTCAFPMEGSVSGKRVQINFSSTTGTAATFNCTGVAGYQGNSNAVTKSATVRANSPVQMVFLAGDFAGAPPYFPLGHFSVSCGLPPGVGINDSYVLISR